MFPFLGATSLQTTGQSEAGTLPDTQAVKTPAYIYANQDSFPQQQQQDAPASLECEDAECGEMGCHNLTLSQAEPLTPH